ncbi:MAG: M48 family metallopeptidase [Pirellulales bacterium]|nr:M48 family metallopeptidase [Pirellulales bacterium]
MPEPSASGGQPIASTAHTGATIAAGAPKPTALVPERTPAELEQARRYARIELMTTLADQALDLVYLGTMALVVAVPLSRWLGGSIASDTLRLIALYAITLLGHELVSFPLSFYDGHIVEHRFGFSTLTLVGWLKRHLLSFALAAGLGLAMFVGLFWIIWLCGAWWWLIAAGAFFVVSVLLSQLVPVLVVPLFYKVDRLELPALSERLARLTAGTGLSIEGVYRLKLSDETTKANAMLAGLGHTRRVLLGDTLLDSFTLDELEVIFAHEIGHHVHRHIPKMLATGVLYSAAGFWCCDRLLAWWVTAHYGRFDYATLPVAALPLLMFSLTAFFLLLAPLQNAISRRYERQCDRYALARTGLREAYLSAFRKLERLNKGDPDPHPLEVIWLHSHPPIAERLAMALEPATAD